MSVAPGKDKEPAARKSAQQQAFPVFSRWRESCVWGATRYAAATRALETPLDESTNLVVLAYRKMPLLPVIEYLPQCEWNQTA